jgi:hypothetical protein
MGKDGREKEGWGMFNDAFILAFSLGYTVILSLKPRWQYS